MSAGSRLKIALLGAAGRMGREVVTDLSDAPDFQLVAAVGRSGDENIGRDIGEIAGGRPLGVALSDDVKAAAQAADVFMDFSGPNGFKVALDACRGAGCAFLSGTTGLGDAEHAELAAAGREIAALYAPNMSFGMAVLDHLAEEAAKMLGEDFDVEIVEMHHRNKKDAPSGSALRLGETIAAARGTTLAQCAEFDRHGRTERAPGSIGFASLRGGDVAGDHTVIFAGEGERLELTFRAGGRHIFARGALAASRWLAGRPAGVYSLSDCLRADGGRG